MRSVYGGALAKMTSGFYSLINRVPAGIAVLIQAIHGSGI
jgi:threonine/homoserine efflux transporter RhtA